VIFLNFYEANKINFKKDYYIDTPYPNITVKRLPFEVAVILKRIFAGNKSEMTSIMQYVYQKNILSNVPSLNNLASALEDISVKEMQHYEILSRVMVGANIGPKNCVYIDGNADVCDFWKSNYIDYTKDIVKMLEADIALEQKAIVEYAELMAVTNDTNLKEIVARIIEDEKTHIEYFKAVLEAIKI